MKCDTVDGAEPKRSGVHSLWSKYGWNLADMDGAAGGRGRRRIDGGMRELTTGGTDDCTEHGAGHLGPSGINHLGAAGDDTTILAGDLAVDLTVDLTGNLTVDGGTGTVIHGPDNRPRPRRRLHPRRLRAHPASRAHPAPRRPVHAGRRVARADVFLLRRHHATVGRYAHRH
jgi:hypothetical protein